ncbi:Atxe2 family lasso peptide isopeptidase [Asticcacaulis sp. LKC15W]|uniref:Atxe2 family lasso peptide isopeptidase n=2 Tax=Asticcacaulis machinosus TaxID=2984211 RepID=A0ABT5HHU9_9CAUL|nr:Atxe2 family lasso peptide isopeptidase [Asticcacaulis machinosus]MDC7675174.1 Atxe2 family lasso peptide isopeptidase [Asticcacaulis machinosus]
MGAGPVLADATARDLVEVVDLSGLALSLDGQWVAYRREQARIEDNSIQSHWYVARVAGGEGHPLSDGGWPLRDSAGQSMIEAPQWSPDGRFLYYRAAFKGEIELWRVEVSTARSEQVTRAGANLRDFRLSEDGRWVTASFFPSRDAIAREEARQYAQGVRLDASVPIGQPLFRSNLTTGQPSTVRYSGSWMDRAPLLADQPPVVRRLDTQSGAWSEVSGDLAGVVSASTALSGEVMAVTSRQGRRAAIIAQTNETVMASSRTRSLVVTDNRGMSLSCDAVACTAGMLEWLVWTPDGRAVVFASRDYTRANAQSVYRWFPDTGRVDRVARSNGLLNGGRLPEAPCAVGNSVLVCVEADPRTPPRLVAFHGQGRRKAMLDAPNQGLFEGKPLVAETLNWVSDEGQAYSGIYYPATDGTGPAPLFVNYYTCRGFLRGGLGDEWPFAALAAQGVASLCINNPPPSPRNALTRYNRAPSAISAIVNRLSKEGQIDRCRVGMGGLSFGSEVTYWTMMHSDLLAAASVTSTAISPSYYWYRGFRDQAFRDELRATWGLGAPEETPERWKEISPALQIDRLRVPLLAQVPEQEYLEMLDFIVPMRHAGTPVDMYVFPDEPHMKFQPRHQYAAYTRNIDWFRFWLADRIDPSNEKAEQFAIWSKMRDAYRASPRSVRSGCPTAAS